MTGPARPNVLPADTCVQCGLCLPHCPTYRLTGSELYSPRGRLAAMSAVAHGTAAIDATYDDVLSTCLGCRACEAVCPGLVPYGAAYEAARAELTEARPTAGRRVRRVLLGRVLGSPTAMQVATAGAAIAQRVPALRRLLPRFARRGLNGLRRLEVRPRSWRGLHVEPSDPRGSVALLAGCVMDPWFGPVHQATIEVLTRAGFAVWVPDAQTCCGALAAHDGHRGEARRLAGRNVDAFAGFDHIVANAAGCSAHLKEYGHWTTQGSELASRVLDATELVARLIDAGDLPRLGGRRGRVAVQDPCHLRHAQRIVGAPRTVVAAAGYEPVEIDPRGLCCGAAGIYSTLHPDTSDELGRQKARQIAVAGVPVVASANPGCEMQIRTYVPPTVRVAHPIELYWETLQRTGT